MTTTLRLKTNLNCQSCVATVTPHLNAEPAISRWHVDTSTPDKVLTAEGERLAQETVRAAVARAGFQVLGTLPAPADNLGGTIEAPRSVAVTYYPLLLLIAFLVGVVAIAEFRAGTFDWARAMPNFMGAFFVTFAFFKLLDVRGFADSYRMYDVVARQVPAYGYVYPFIELLLGIAYLSNFQPFATNLATLIVMAVSSVGVVQSLIEKKKIRCACLGTVFNLPMSTVTVIEDTSMVLMAAVMLAAGSH